MTYDGGGGVRPTKMLRGLIRQRLGIFRSVMASPQDVASEEKILSSVNVCISGK